MREKRLALMLGQGKMLIRTPFEVCPLTYQKVRLRNNAKTHSPAHYYLVYREFSYPFWWHLFTAILLQAIKVTKTITSLSSIQSTQQSVHHRRGDIGISLPHLIRPGKDRDVPPFKTQWCLSIPYGVTHLSQSHNPETFPPSDGSFSTPQIEELPRQTSIVNDPKTRTSHQSDLRSGFHRSYPVWQTGDGTDRLQSQEVGSPLLSSSSLLQWGHQGFLAWRTSPWRYPYRHWNRRTPEDLLCQIISLCKDRN